jgi:hypothetical protein
VRRYCIFTLALLASGISTTAQTQIPGVRKELSEKAGILGIAQFEILMMDKCQMMYPTMAAFQSAVAALDKVIPNLEKSFEKDEIAAVVSRAQSTWKQLEPMLTLNPEAITECSKASQNIGGQISLGMFSGDNR